MLVFKYVTYLGLLVICLLQGCSSFSVSSRIENAKALVNEAGWQQQDIHTQDFIIRSYFSPHQDADTVTIYIEGDGLAWISKTQPSSNPTPINPLALKLAIKDSGNVAYLARPCQYATSSLCERKYWTSARFAPEVLASMDQAISEIKAHMQAQKLILIGYSGGGAIATLIASRRNDVVRLITIAGNLDPVAWTQLHNVSPLTESLNPKDEWQSLVHIPQLHLVGGKDQIIPVEVAQSYQAAFPNSNKPEIRIIPSFDHHCCWLEEWPKWIHQ